MARLFGLIGNRPDLGARALQLESTELRAVAGESPLGWGIGFYQGGEVLMRRRPVDERPVLDVSSLASGVRTDLLVGHVRSATVGALRTENTHPFRYRQWLFAQTGTITAFATMRERLVASVPDFLRSSIRGETDAELLFHVFLSFLHDDGHLDDSPGEPKNVRDALRATLALVDGMALEAGGPRAVLNIVAANGEALFAFHRGGDMRCRTFCGRQDTDTLIGDDTSARRKASSATDVHISLVASDFDNVPGARWSAVPKNAIATFLRGRDARIDTL